MTIIKPVFALAASMLALVAAAPVPQDPPRTIPGLSNYSLPAGQPTATPTPVPSPTPSAVPVPAAPVIVLPSVPVAPRAAPVPRATPLPRSVAPATPSAAPAIAAPEIAPTPSASPAPIATPTPVESAPMPVPIEAPSEAWPLGWIIAAAAVVVALGLLLLLRRRRRKPPIVWDAPEPDAVAEVPPPAAPVAAPPSPRFLSPTPPATPTVRPWLSLSLSPRRAGLNMITATADVDVIVTNTGNAPARQIRIGVRLLSAASDQDSALAAIFAEPLGRPITAAFDLAPGEVRTVRALATMVRDSIHVMTAGGRPMFVPVVAVNALYEHGDGETGQTAQGFAIGIERAGAAKLAPFWLDQPGAMHDAIGQRAHEPSLRR